MDTTEKDLRVSNTQRVGPDGCVNRLQQAIDTLISEFSGQSIIVHATATIHAGSTRGQKDHPLCSPLLDTRLNLS